MESIRKKEESLTEHWFFRVLIGLTVIAVLFFAASRYLSDVFDDVGEYKVSLMSDRFVKSATHMHQQWSAMGKPKHLKLDYYELATRSIEINIHMNKKGWPLSVNSGSEGLDCEQLWQYFAENNPDKQEALLVEIVQERAKCLYYWEDDGIKQKVLEYDVDAGRIKQNH